MVTFTSHEMEIFLPLQLTHARKVFVVGAEEGDKYHYDEHW